MKKTFITILAMVCSLGIFADEIPGIVVSKSDGGKVPVATSAIHCIKYGEGTMAVLMKDGSQQTFSLDDITTITFESLPTAIRNIMAETKGNVIVTDLSGRVLYEGSANGQMPSLHGLYVITTNGESRAVLIR